MFRRLSLAALAAALTAGLAMSGCADRQKSSTADARLSFSGATDFQRVAIYSTREVRGTLTNVGRSYLNVVELWVEDADGAYLADFAHEGEHELMPGGTCEIKVRFNPRRGGDHPATLVIRSDSREEPLLRVPLTAAAVDAQATMDQGALDFGRIEIGSEKLRTIALQNPSELPVKVTPKLVGQDKDEFVAEPITLAPYETRSLDVRFVPSREGKKLAALAVAPCEGCMDQVVTLVAEGLDKAIIAEPPELDFGQVPMDRDATLTVTLRNISTEPQDVTQLALDANTDPSFTHTAGVAPVTLQGGEERAFSFRFSPGHMGGSTGEAVFALSSKRNPELKVPMFGFGGAAEVCVTPLEHRFSEKPVGARVPVRVSVRNCGSSNSAPLQISEIVKNAAGNGVGGDSEFSVSPVALPRTLNAGEELIFEVFYEPTYPGEHAASVGIRTSGFRGSIARVEVSGSARVAAPCQLEVTPGAVDFGTVEPGGDPVLGVKIRNVGTDVCPVKNIEIVDDGGGVFTMPGGEIPGVLVEATYYFSFMVQFTAPKSGGTFSGALKIEQANPAMPEIYVPLAGNAQTSCLVAVPPFLDFGITRPDCSPPPLTTTLMNRCTTPVVINSIEIGPGTTDGEFRIDRRPSTPRTLQPGDREDVVVEYLAQVPGMNLSPLFVDVAGLREPFLISLIGESSRKGEKLDTFVQQDGGKVDVLFVVDNTASMVEEHPKLVSAIPSFVSAAQQKNVDLHIAVTTTGLDVVSNVCPGGAQGGEAGRFFPVDNARPRVLTLGTPNLTQVLQQNVQVGQCAMIEKGFEAMRLALSEPLVDSADDPRTAVANDGNAGFLRDEAALAVVFVGDEDDHSAGEVDDYLSWMRGMKGMNQPQRATIFAIAPSGQSCPTAGGTGTRYAEAAAKTGGDVLSVCAADYGPLLAQVAQKAFSPTDTFALSSAPEPGSMRVFVDGTEQPGGWTYDSAKNQIVFSSMPPAGAKIEVRYRKTCAQ